MVNDMLLINEYLMSMFNGDNLLRGHDGARLPPHHSGHLDLRSFSVQDGSSSSIPF